MSFANEEPHVDLEWNENETFMMRQDLELLRVREYHNFIVLQTGNGLQKPFETFLGGVLRPETSSPRDVWISIYRLGKSEVSTVSEGSKKYLILPSFVEVQERQNPSRKATLQDIDHLRFLLNENVGHWSEEDSWRIAEKLHETDKRRPTYRFLGRLFGPPA